MNIFTPESAPTETGVGLAKCDHVFEEAKYIQIFLVQIPIQPVCFIILIIGIIVTTLIRTLRKSAKLSRLISTKIRLLDDEMSDI